MRRIIPLSLLLMLATAGSALADRRHDRHDNRPHSYQRNNYRSNNVRVHRQPIHHHNGYYRFSNGHSVRYTRPVITQRYYNYRVRPTLLVENYAPVDGYVWVRGHWNWNGGEWIWISGHYAVAY
jgi:hypothetical protein